MAMTDPLGDMLTRIRNAQMRSKSSVLTPSSKLRGWVLDVLKDEGYIRSYELKKDDNGKENIKVSLRPPCKKMKTSIENIRIFHKAYPFKICGLPPSSQADWLAGGLPG